MHDTRNPVAAFLLRLWERLVRAVRSRRFWIASVVFGIALVAGGIVSAIWLHGRTVKAVAAAGVEIADPTHPPLPTPMAGSLSTLGVPAARGPDAAYIAETPPPEAAVEPEVPSTDAEATTQADAAVGVPVQVSADSPPQVIDRADPDYPAEALRAQEEGEVWLHIAVDPVGNVEDVRVGRSSGSRALDGAAVDAARRWRFKPAMRQGQPITGQIEVPVDFRLEER